MAFIFARETLLTENKNKNYHKFLSQPNKFRQVTDYHFCLQCIHIVSKTVDF